ncbi:hypothetical protein B1756_00635 [Natrarchaeobaculum aegyptiacum]|uniref:Uncharacterized protein n=1 Tax=Natrarchaeobaculum aegyptiacum TaxID=745377 RepID=A0A2Z2HTL2_9EURY|nr:hypothetical protein B1756_00635 [Natrarchaeobaculum aegyptiacum]
MSLAPGGTVVHVSLSRTFSGALSGGVTPRVTSPATAGPGVISAGSTIARPVVESVPTAAFVTHLRVSGLSASFRSLSSRSFLPTAALAIASAVGLLTVERFSLRPLRPPG